MGLIIRSSAIHAAGCYTTSQIEKGALVVEYTGPVIDKDEADRRYEGKPITYLFAVGDGTRVIDGHGTAMFVNHSCEANCETEEIDGRIWIRAVRNIAAGEEISYDYCLFDGDELDAPCNCGAKKCRGSMFSVDELKRRRREATRANGVNRVFSSAARGNSNHENATSGGRESQSHTVNPQTSIGHQYRNNGSSSTRGKTSNLRSTRMHA